MSSSSSEITSRPQLVEFTNRFVQPPSALYITRDDELRVDVASLFNGTIVRLDARILEPDGAVHYHQQRITIDTTSVFQSVVFPAAEGFLLGGALQVLQDGGVNNWTYGQVGLSKGEFTTGNILHSIARGYLGRTSPLYFPGGDFRSPVEGPGYFRTVFGATPAAGANILDTVTPAVRRRVHTIQVLMTTSAAVATRRMILRIQRGGAVLYRLVAVTTQLASLTHTYTFGHYGVNDVLIFNTIHVNAPSEIWVEQNDVFISGVDSLQAGDNIGQPTYWVQEWFKP